VKDDSIWQKLQEVFRDSDTIVALAELYYERGTVTWEEARAWAVEQWHNARPS
jgi:hypothetical protein